MRSAFCDGGNEMPDMGSIAAAIGGLKTAADITKGFLDLKEAAAVQGRVIELQRIGGPI
jgi:hypothetical protein